jgi:hypothetical protein
MHLEEDLLDRVLGLGPVHEDPVHHGVEPVEIPVEERRERVRIASTHPFQIEGVLVIPAQLPWGYVRGGFLCPVLEIFGHGLRGPP